jgi:prophage antirepressor-like protein
MSDANHILLFFIFQGHDIRVVIHDGEHWFVAKDVCEVLEVSNVSLAINGNPSRNETGLDEDEKRIYQVNTSGGPRATFCINEPGLYHLIAKSQKLEAKTFQRWVWHDAIASQPEHQKDGVGISDSISGKHDIPIRYVVGKKSATL